MAPGIAPEEQSPGPAAMTRQLRDVEVHGSDAALDSPTLLAEPSPATGEPVGRSPPGHM